MQQLIFVYRLSQPEGFEVCVPILAMTKVLPDVTNFFGNGQEVYPSNGDTLK